MLRCPLDCKCRGGFGKFSIITDYSFNDDITDEIITDDITDDIITFDEIENNIMLKTPYNSEICINNIYYDYRTYKNTIILFEIVKKVMNFENINIKRCFINDKDSLIIDHHFSLSDELAEKNIELMKDLCCLCYISCVSRIKFIEYEGAPNILFNKYSSLNFEQKEITNESLNKYFKNRDFIEYLSVFCDRYNPMIIKNKLFELFNEIEPESIGYADVIYRNLIIHRTNIVAECYKRNREEFFVYKSK